MSVLRGLTFAQRPSWACAAVLAALALTGCRHRGAAWFEPVEPVVGEVELFVLGAPRKGPHTQAVARELERSLADAAAAGRTPIVAWLGTDFGPPGPDHARACPSPGEAFRGPGLSELSQVLARAAEDGASIWGLPGPDGWRCHLTGFDAAAAPLPYRQPGLAYVLRVDTRGQLELASSCEGHVCSVAPPEDDTLVELVALDFSFWHYPELAGTDLSEAVLAQQADLLAALAEQPPRPRILLTPIPVETAGKHGLGARKQRASFRYLPEFVQQALADGLFVGVLGGLERSLQVSEDLSTAIHRGDRSFIERPIFEVVAGSAGGASHTLPTSRGISLLPDLESEHPGFARVAIAEDQVQLRIHARVAGRWRVAGIELPLRPEPLEPMREPPTIQPCPSCDPQAGAADGEVFVPRGERPN